MEVAFGASEKVNGPPQHVVRRLAGCSTSSLRGQPPGTTTMRGWIGRDSPGRRWGANRPGEGEDGGRRAGGGDGGGGNPRLAHGAAQERSELGMNDSRNRGASSGVERGGRFV